MTTENSQAPASDLVVSTHGAVRVLSMNRPQTKNGLTLELLSDIVEAIKAAHSDETIRAVMLTGRGESFSSGLDFKAAMNLVQAGGADFAEQTEKRMRNYFHAAIRALTALPKPVIAYLDGVAAGFGCDLALACDLRIGTRRARFGEIFIKRGLMPDGGGTYTLPRMVGLARAFDMMLTGDIVEADEALRIGLLSRLVDGEVEAMAFAERIAAGPPLVMAEIKHALYSGQSQSFDAALENEVRGQLKLLRSQDFIEGVSAFLMKRPPQFTGQ
jgi:enoyl-CoA hydratase/carnithine racemase